MAKHYKNQNKIIQIKSASGKRYQTAKKPAQRSVQKSVKKSGSRFASTGFSEKTEQLKSGIVSAGAKIKGIFESKIKLPGRSKSRYQPKFGSTKEPIPFERIKKAEAAKPQKEHVKELKQEPKQEPQQEPQSKAFSFGKFGQEKKPKEKKQRKKKVNPLTLPENLPSTEQLETELKRERNQKANGRLVRNTIFALITVAATAVLVATLFLPILQIYGTSMTPTLSEGEIVVSIKGSAFERGDIISFYYNNKILVKRVIAFEGEYVNINDDGTVLINNKAIEEPYITEKSFGECDLKLPYQVPAGKIFVLGDHRDTSVDSRSSVMGCVAEEQIVGKIVFRVWPFDRMGEIN